MDDDAFWTLVARTRAAAEAGGPEDVVARHVQTLAAALADLPDREVEEFERLRLRTVARADDRQLRAAASLALGGLGDDGFLDFRGWLVGHGRETFERVLADPDNLVELSWDEDENDFGDAEAWSHVATEELEERGLEPDLDGEPSEFDPPAREPFPEDDDAWVAARFPRLWAASRKFSRP